MREPRSPLHLANDRVKRTVGVTTTRKRSSTNSMHCWRRVIRVSILSFRSITLWMLGYPEAALGDVVQAVKHAREIGHAPSLIYALAATSVPQLLAGNYASVNAQTDEAVAIAEEKSE